MAFVLFVLRGNETITKVAKASKLQRDTRAADEKYRRSHTRVRTTNQALLEGGAGSAPGSLSRDVWMSIFAFVASFLSCSLRIIFL